MDTDGEHPLLLVEDSEADARLTTLALNRAGLKCPIVLCHDGDKALDYLWQRGIYAHPTTAIRPALILLDLNMPGSDGRYVLQQIKTHPTLKIIPVIAFTTSDDQRDIDICYQHGANGYIKKPADFQAFLIAMTHLVAYWFDTNITPQDPDRRPTETVLHTSQPRARRRKVEEY